jgi:hypothetical protein
MHFTNETSPATVGVMKRALFAITILLLCAGCLMDQRVAKLQVGMTKAQVLAIVRKRPTGEKIENGTETLQWETGHYATFRNGRLTAYGTQ